MQVRVTTTRVLTTLELPFNTCAGGLIAERLVVELVFTVTRSNALQVGDVSGDLLDGLHLLAKEFGLNEVGHLVWNEKYIGKSNKGFKQTKKQKN